jgi:hypothetical protein
MADNGIHAAGLGGNQIAIADGAGGYVFNQATATFTVINLPGAAHVCYLDGYFIATINGNMSAYCSDLYDGTTWNPLAMVQISASPDTIQTVADLNQQLFFIKTDTTEVWYDAGVPTSQGFPVQFWTSGLHPHGQLQGRMAHYL